MINKELIEKLASEAWNHANSNSIEGDGLYGSLYTEKLAELIVQECVGIVKGGRFLHDQAPTALFAKECSDAIKRHFGVEE